MEQQLKKVVRKFTGNYNNTFSVSTFFNRKKTYWNLELLKYLLKLLLDLTFSSSDLLLTWFFNDGSWMEIVLWETIMVNLFSVFSFEFSVFVKDTHTRKMMLVTNMLTMITKKSIKTTVKFLNHDIETFFYTVLDLKSCVLPLFELKYVS